MSCWQQALTNLWIKDYNYSRSEIDKYAIQVTQNNFPNTIQIWDVTKISYKIHNDRVDWITWALNYKVWSINWWLNVFRNIRKFDLLLWWSPCQWFSFAGKQLNFQDERSKLFFEYVRILKEVKPKYFLLENVKMKKEYQDVISEHLFWIQPIEINSELLVAQKRKRLYWIWELQEDWTYKRVEIEQPKDRGILLKDILEENVDEKYYLSEETYEKLKKFESNSRLSDLDWKSYCLNTIQWWHRQPKIIIPEATNKWYAEVKPWECFDLTQPNSKTRRWRNMIEKSNCMTAGNFQFMNYDWSRIRKLTPIECERLQWVKDNYTTCVSNSQRYKMLGNWWTIPVIEHILKHLI